MLQRRRARFRPVDDVNLFRISYKSQSKPGVRHLGGHTEKTILRLLIKFFILIGIGYGLRKTDHISERFEKELGSFLIRIVLPFNILYSANTGFDPDLSRNLLYSAIFAAAYYAVMILGLLAFVRILKKENETKKIFVTLGAFQNVSFLGFPIIQGLFGPSGLLYGVIFNLIFLFFFLSFAQTYISGKQTDIFKSIITDPGIIASIAAIPIFLSPVKLPDVVNDVFHLMGSMMTPISLLIIGSRMTSIRFKEIFTDGLAWLVSAIRLLIAPGIAYLMLLPFRLDPTMTAILILISGLPSGAMNVILANEYDCDVNLASKSVALSTFLTLASLPLLMAVVG